MKKIAQGLLMVALGLLVATAAYAYDPTTYTAGTGVNNTAHDLSVPGVHGMNYPASPADPYHACAYWCHAPHNTYRASVANGGPNGLGAPAGLGRVRLSAAVEPHAAVGYGLLDVLERHRRSADGRERLPGDRSDDDARQHLAALPELP